MERGCCERARDRQSSSVRSYVIACLTMKGKRDRGLLAIALFKWFKGSLLLLVGFGCVKLLHRDVAGVFEALADQLRVDAGNRYLGALLSKLRLLNDRKIEALSGMTFL